MGQGGETCGRILTKSSQQGPQVGWSRPVIGKFDQILLFYRYCLLFCLGNWRRTEPGRPKKRRFLPDTTLDRRDAGNIPHPRGRSPKTDDPSAGRKKGPPGVDPPPPSFYSPCVRRPPATAFTMLGRLVLSVGLRPAGPLAGRSAPASNPPGIQPLILPTST